MNALKIYTHFYHFLTLCAVFFATSTLPASAQNDLSDFSEDKKAVDQASFLESQNFSGEYLLDDCVPIYRPRENTTDSQSNKPETLLPQSIATEYTVLWDKIEDAENKGNQKLADNLTIELSRVFSSGIGQTVAFPEIQADIKPRVRTPKSSPRDFQIINKHLPTPYLGASATELKTLQNTPSPATTVNLDKSPCEKIDGEFSATSPDSCLGLGNDEAQSLTESPSDSRDSITISQEFHTARKTNNWDRAKQLSTDFYEARFAELKEKETS